jgi:hypothetical protein
MKVLVDTSVWSLALRRNRVVESPYVLEPVGVKKDVAFF